MADEVTKPKVKKSRHNTRTVLSETSTEVVTDIQQKAYKGEKIGNTVRKDHKFDPKQRQFAGRPL
jgi:hypothetical protein